MWYEVLPSVILVGGFIYSINIVGVLITKTMYGHPSRRDLTNLWDRHMHDRDVGIIGNPYKTMDIENILDN